MDRFFRAGRKGHLPDEYPDFILIRDVYHCTPAELDMQDAGVIEMHKRFIGIENDAKHLDGNRSEQRARIQARLKG